MFNFRFVIASLLAATVASLTLVPATTQRPNRTTQTPDEVLSVNDVDRTSNPESLASNSTYYILRRDLRRCAAPLCGGYFIKRVNQSLTQCANGRPLAECYVAHVDWNGQPEVEANKALLRGSVTKGDKDGKYGVLQVTESWTSASDKPPTGVFYRVRDLGIRCIAAPCATHQEAKLNTTVSRNVAGIDLTGADAPENLRGDAFTAMTSQEGILVTGSHVPVTGPAGKADQLKAAQFYLRKKTTSARKPCIKTGCSNQICADENMMSTCEWRPEYECYQKATCERQANGNCGFTRSPELTACLTRK